MGFGYNTPDAEWMDVTEIGSGYEQQCDTRRPNHYRHRRVSFDRSMAMEWQPGPAPDSKDLK